MNGLFGFHEFTELTFNPKQIIKNQQVENQNYFNTSNIWNIFWRTAVLLPL